MATVESRLKILQMLTAENPPPIPLTDQTVTVSDPVVSIGTNPGNLTGRPPQWNTKVTLSAIPGSGYKGSVDVYYQRTSLLEAFTSSRPLVQESPFAVQDIINKLDSRYQAMLTLDDLLPVDPSLLPTQSGIVTWLTLQAQPLSLAWVGAVRVALVYGIPDQARVLHHTLHHVLPNGYW